MIGTTVNVAAIIVGSLIGYTLKKGIPIKIKNTIMQGLSLAVALLGLQMALDTNNPIILIVSIVLGGLTGELVNLEGRVKWLGRRLETFIERRTKENNRESIGKAFVTASIVFCVGAMAVMGAIEDGLKQTPNILFAKSAIDGIAAIVFASTMGIGVIFSAIPVLIYQGSITLTASWSAAFFTPAIITELTAAGGLIIVGIGFNLLGLTRIRVANLLPAIAIAPVIVYLLALST